MNRQYDEVIPLTPGLEEEGNARLHTQTLWTNNAETIIIQVIKIDDYNVGVKYMYHTDFQKHPSFSQDFSFGKRIIRIPPGRHSILISYKGEMRYVRDSVNMNHDQLITYSVNVPADSLCVAVPDMTRYKIDAEDPKIEVNCRVREKSDFGLLRDLL